VALDPAALREREMLADSDFPEAVCLLGARVAEGLAGLRATFGLESRAEDPFAALLAALPRTELARRASEAETELARRASEAETELARRLADVESDLAAARAALVESERTAADVERRSESLKAALRERSADLAQALARADAAEKQPAPAPVERVEIERVAIEDEPAQDDAFTRAVVQAREQHAADALSTALLDREALFARLEAEAQELESARRQARGLLVELDARAAPVAVERARVQLELDALLGDLAERESTIESMRRDLTWRAREMDAMHAELQSARYRLLARTIVERAERWVKPGRTEDRP